MNIFNKINTFLNKNSKTTNQSVQPIYQHFDLNSEDITNLFKDIIQPSETFIGDISITISNKDQFIHSNVSIKSIFKLLSFSTKSKLIDVWHDTWTSTAVFEIKHINIHLISLLPNFLQNWCGQKLIAFISFIASIVQKNNNRKKAHFYLQDNFLYIDFHPWLNGYLDPEEISENEAKSHWLTNLFFPNSVNRGKRYIKNHVIFGSQILKSASILRLYLYKMPGNVYENINFDTEETEHNFFRFGNFLEWLFAIATSFLLVSFLVPFGMAYVKLEPIKLDNLFSIPSILLYNTFIVLIPLFLFRIVMMPMYRLWQSRHGRIEILQAEVSRDQVFLPLLREWIIVLQKNKVSHIPPTILNEIRSLLVEIGKQKYLLVNKIMLIDQRRRMYMSIITISYLGVCLLEILFITGTLPPPQFFVDHINQILGWLFLDK